ncbi:MAG: hypothetical protein PF445_07355 [Melioribacteraceae bacterium]|jgi:hypothetical protein|nr:hypothetical protein [Melioribacteraceae bacterium]
MSKIELHNTALREEDNQEYYQLVKLHNTIVRKIRILDKKINELRQPFFLIFCHYYKLKSFSTIIAKLKLEINLWNNEFHIFIHEPTLTFGIHEEGILGFLHYTRNLELMNARINKIYDVAVSKISKAKSEQGNQINFLIAIISASLSLIGLIIALKSINLL